MTLADKIIIELEKYLKPDEDKRFNIFNRFEMVLEDTSAADWLRFRTSGARVHWQDRRTRLAVTAFGEADLLSGPDLADFSNLFYKIRHVLENSDPRIRYYGGLSFTRHNHHEPIWRDFGDYYFLLPRYEIIKDTDHTKFAINYRREDLREIIAELPDFFQMTADTAIMAPAMTEKYHLPDRMGWKMMVGQALNAIHSGVYEKIVLARKTKFSFSEPLNPADILENLKVSNPGSTYFLFQPKPGAVFIGGTPELLYQRNGSDIFSEAIAGTRMRGKNEQEDEKYEAELLNSEKDRWEHRFVMDNVHEILEGLCSEMDSSADVSVLKLSRVQHLYTSFHGTLKPDITDAQIIAQLHPTPAVGGYPTDNALPEIESLEPFRRGWYAAPVGWLARDAAHFAVAIRSGLVLGSDLYLYSGAGIVKGSEADLEWEEINNKIASFLRVLNINGDEPVANEKERMSLILK